MGMSRGAIALLGRTLQRAPRSGSAITFGVQKVAPARAEAAQLLARAGIEAGAPQRQDGALHQDELFRMLGYDAVESIDVFPDEKPTHVLDLNRPLPSALLGRFDLVYDGGTMEHCFSPPDVLANTVGLAKSGGRIVHHLPLNNWVDHGFYQFSPTLFFDFYTANGFRDLAMTLHFSAAGKETYIAYDPDRDGHLPYSLGGGAQVLGFFTAVKGAAPGPIAFPVQGRYRRTFGGERKSAPDSGPRWLARLRRSWLKRTFALRAKRF
jgi:hypothetical protein